MTIEQLLDEMGDAIEQALQIIRSPELKPGDQEFERLVTELKLGKPGLYQALDALISGRDIEATLRLNPETVTKIAKFLQIPPDGELIQELGWNVDNAVELGFDIRYFRQNFGWDIDDASEIRSNYSDFELALTGLHMLDLMVQAYSNEREVIRKLMDVRYNFHWMHTKGLGPHNTPHYYGGPV